MYLKKRAAALSIPLPCPSLQPPLQGSLLPLVNLQSAKGGSGRRSLMVHSEWNGNRGAGPDYKNIKGQAKVQERRKPNQLAARGTAKQNKQTRQSYRWSWSNTEGCLQYLQDSSGPGSTTSPPSSQSSLTATLRPNRWKPGVSWCWHTTRLPRPTLWMWMRHNPVRSFTTEKLIVSWNPFPNTCGCVMNTFTSSHNYGYKNS